MPQSMKIAIYARVSTEGKKNADGTREKGQSVEPQLLELREYCARQGYAVVGEWTDVMSGTKAARPGLDALLTHCQLGGVDAITVVKLDRLGRSMTNVIHLIDDLTKMGVAVICTSQSIDTRKESPMGKFIVQIMAAFAELDRAFIVERTVAGLANARAKGTVLGRPNKGLIPEADRHAVIELWRMRGRPGGLRGLGQLLGGVSQTWAWKLEKQYPTSGTISETVEGPPASDITDTV